MVQTLPYDEANRDSVSKNELFFKSRDSVSNACSMCSFVPRTG